MLEDTLEISHYLSLHESRTVFSAFDEQTLPLPVYRFPGSPVPRSRVTRPSNRFRFIMIATRESPNAIGSRIMLTNERRFFERDLLLENELPSSNERRDIDTIHIPYPTCCSSLGSAPPCRQYETTNGTDLRTTGTFRYLRCSATRFEQLRRFVHYCVAKSIVTFISSLSYDNGTV